MFSHVLTQDQTYTLTVSDTYNPRYSKDINLKLRSGFEWNDWLSSWFPFFIYIFSYLRPGHKRMRIKRCDIIIHYPIMCPFNISSNSGNRFMPHLVLGCTQCCYLLMMQIYPSGGCDPSSLWKHRLALSNTWNSTNFLLFLVISCR